MSCDWKRRKARADNQKAWRRSHGFTLIEMLITIGIAAIFSMLALPSFVETVRSTRMQTTAEQLHTDLLMAKREAIKRNKKVLLCPARPNAVAGTDDLCLQDKTKWADGWVVCYVNTAAALPSCNTTDPDPNGPDGPNPIRRRSKLDSALYIDQSLGPKYIAFEANGKTSNDTPANPSSKLKLAGNWAGASASWFLCTQGSGNIALKKKSATDSSDPC